MHRTFAIPVLHCILGLSLTASLSACGSENSNGQTVAVNLSLLINAPHAQTSSHSSLVAWIHRWWPSGNAAWAQSVEEIERIQVDITGPGMPFPASTAVKVPNASSGQVISVSLQVPPGHNRTIVVSGFNGDSPPRKIFGGTVPGVSLTPGAPVNLEVVLVRVFTVEVQKQGTGSGTVTTTPLGIDCGASCSAQFEQATTVSLIATAGPGSVFSGWSGTGCSGVVPTCTVVINSNLSVMATFTANGPIPMSSLTVHRSGSGSGTVTSAPTGIDCGNTCTASFATGNSVTLTPMPTSGSLFVGWSGACTGAAPCTVAMTSDQIVSAQFDLVPDLVTLSVSKSGRGDGKVFSLPGGIDCGGACQATFPRNTVVTLTAAPNDISVFNQWSGPGCSGDGSCTITMDGDKHINAKFDIDLIFGSF